LATLDIDHLPDALYRRLKKRAELHHRSIAQEVIHILAQALEHPQTLCILSLRGLGKDLWKDDAAEHVRRERQAWD
jgi:plasmid stability protein